MRTVILIIMIVCVTPLSGFGEQKFSYNEIDWSNSRETISTKLVNDNNFIILWNKLSDQDYSSFEQNNIIPSALVRDIEFINTLNASLKQCNQKVITQVYTDENSQRYFSKEKDSIIVKGGRFYFSKYDGNLLFYKIFVINNKAEIVLKALTEKIWLRNDFRKRIKKQQ